MIETHNDSAGTPALDGEARGNLKNLVGEQTPLKEGEQLPPEEKIKELSSILEREIKKNAELTTRMKYLQADISNLQKQSDKMLVDVRNQAKSSLILDLISIKEDLERALTASSSSDVGAIVEGLKMLVSKISSLLKSEDVEPVRADVGGKLDPRIHEAVGFSDSEQHEDGSILSLVRPGYLMMGKLIKPALVEVARKKPEAHQSEEKGEHEEMQTPTTSETK